MEYIRFKWHIVKEIFIIGLSDFVRMIAMNLTMALYNNVLRRYGGEIPIAVFGIFFRITSFIFMPMMGIAQGAQPIFGFNFGAKKHDRVKKTLHLANISATVICVVGFMIFMFFPEPLYLIFSSDPELVSMGKGAMRILVLGLPFIGFQMIAMNLFQALGMARYALFTSLARQVLFLIPMILILPLMFGLTGIWLSFPLADIVSFIVTFILVFFTVKGLSPN
jgi:Na+-driven multidrug efflux pump